MIRYSNRHLNSRLLENCRRGRRGHQVTRCWGSGPQTSTTISTKQPNGVAGRTARAQVERLHWNPLLHALHQGVAQTKRPARTQRSVVNQVEVCQRREQRAVLLLLQRLSESTRCGARETRALEQGPPRRVTAPEVLVEPRAVLRGERHEAVQGNRDVGIGDEALHGS